MNHNTIREYEERAKQEIDRLQPERYRVLSSFPAGYYYGSMLRSSESHPCDVIARPPNPGGALYFVRARKGSFLRIPVNGNGYWQLLRETRIPANLLQDFFDSATHCATYLDLIAQVPDLDLSLQLEATPPGVEGG